MGRVRLLAWQFGHAQDRLARGLDGLSDEEFFWAPVPGCATVRPDGNGSWVIDSDLVDYDGTGPTPVPFTTIAWRLVHLTHITAMCREYTYGPGAASFDEVDVPGSAGEARARWATEATAFAAELDGTPDDHLDDTVRPVWTEPTTVLHMVHVVIEEHVHHGGEIGCLRDLYRAWA